MHKKGLCEMADMNESLISQYANGIKIPGQKQMKRIEVALHRFADDLQPYRFDIKGLQKNVFKPRWVGRRFMKRPYWH
jgi:transcriptional regulator with XRE-family HTH domain